MTGVQTCALPISANGNPDDHYRGLLSFDISTIPSTNTVSNATLIMYQYAQVGGNPYTAGLRINVEHIDLGGTVDTGDFGGGYITLNTATLSTDNSAGQKTADVTAMVDYNFVNSVDAMDFRLSFTSGLNNNNGDEYMQFRSSEYGTATMRPQLQVISCPASSSGSGGSTTTTVIQCTVTNTVVNEIRNNSYDGHVYSDSVINDSNPTLRIGDWNDNTGARGILGFTLDNIPTNAHIISASLQVYQSAVNGTPYTSLGSSVYVDHIDMGTGIDSGDYSVTAYSLGGYGFGIISTTTAIGNKTLTCTSRIQNDIDNGRRTAGFRIRFNQTTDNDGGTDNIEIGANENGTAARRPQLSISWCTN